MTLFLRVLVSNVLPAFVVIAIGFTFDRWLRPDLQSVSRLALYALSPALIFTSLVNSQLQGGEITIVMVFTAVVTLGMTVVSLVTARLMRLNQAASSAFTLSTTLCNSGNFGLSVVLFAYGQQGLEIAIIYFVTSAILSNSVGAYIASRSQGSWHQSLRGILRLPVLYAAILAVFMRLLHYLPPEVIMRPLTPLGQAAVPVMLILLGMQLSRTHLQDDRRLVAFASVYKLVAMTLLAVGLAAAFGLSGLARRVCIVESATPTAVTAALLATEFRARAEVVASTIFLSTLAAAVTLTAVITLLG
ncbi:MAG: AEC family transporter [Anaerolineae bacterium]